MLVSVIIPTYNRAALLERAIKSVCTQTYTNWELLLVDDASNDGTTKLLENLISEDSRIKYFRPWESNMGVSCARNYGIKSSRGALIAFLDSDDEWLEGKLEKQLKLYNRDPYRLCHSNEIWVRRGVRVNQMKKHEKSGGYIYDKCLALCCISPSAAVVERQVFEEIGVFDESLLVCEDYDLWLRVCCKYPVSFIDEPLLVKYGGHSDQLSRRSWGNDIYRLVSLDKILESGKLTREQYRNTLKAAISKSRILSKGFRKHGDLKKALYYEEKEKTYLAVLR